MFGHALCLDRPRVWTGLVFGHLTEGNMSLKPQPYLDSLKSERFLRGLLLRLFSLSSSGVSALRRKKTEGGSITVQRFLLFYFSTKELSK